MEFGARLRWRQWGLGIEVMWEPFLRSAWIVLGPFSCWVEW